MRGYLKLYSLTVPKSNMPWTKTFPTQGIYTLIIFLSRELSLNVGKLGVKRFPKGYYTYTGSAMGKGGSSLRSRVLRHLRKEKRKHWHIDYFLANENAKIIAVLAAQTMKRLECDINCLLREEGDAEIPVRGFGASDCREKCASHLLYFGENDIESRIAALYTERFGSMVGLGLSSSTSADDSYGLVFQGPKVSNF